MQARPADAGDIVTANGTRIRVLVVEGDSALRQGMTRLLGHHPMIDVVAAALDARAALAKLACVQVHCVIVDPATTGGDEALALLAHLRAAEVRGIVVAPRDLAPDRLQRAQEGAGGGVVRCEPLPIPETAIAALVRQLLPLVLGNVGAPARSVASGHPVPTAIAAPPPARAAAASRSLRVVGIGVSTGGPKALAELLPRLPADFPLPIVLVQHMPPKFTQSLAESLDPLCKLRVSEARDGERLERGRVLIAPGGRHLRVVAGDHGEVTKLTEDPPECSCRPSVDYLFRSLATTFGGRALGVVLTGMGKDGWIGSRLIHDAGGRVLAQDEATSTVYGMPRGPVEAGIATAVPLDQMAEAIVHAVKGAPCN